ncbi:MAG: histidine phosphatase family protein [SAR324 cluster bacterium]|nr:histidine phosphatase family protein [SAR324 cluster bacterium]
MEEWMIFNTSPHPLMETSMNLVPVDTGASLFLRHSTRYAIPERTSGAAIPLTPEGIEMVRNWAQTLPFSVSGIYSSSMGRCMETGRIIMETLGLKTDVIPLPILKEPGAFVENIRQAGTIFLEVGPLGLINLQLQGELIPGVIPLSQGVPRIISQCPPAKNARELNIYITHDTVISCLAYYLSGITTLSPEMWPWMLEGLFCWNSGENFHWAWRGQSGAMPLSKLYQE